MFPDLLPALPEIFVAAAGMVLLMVGVFARGDGTRTATKTAHGSKLCGVRREAALLKGDSRCGVPLGARATASGCQDDDRHYAAASTRAWKVHPVRRCTGAWRCDDYGLAQLRVTGGAGCAR